MKKLQLSEVLKRYLTIIGFLLGSGLVGWFGAEVIAKDPMLTAIFAPAINFIAFIFYSELKKRGVVEYLRQK